VLPLWRGVCEKGGECLWGRAVGPPDAEAARRNQGRGSCPVGNVGAAPFSMSFAPF